MLLLSIDKLPEEPILKHQIKEIELVTRFLDPVMSLMLDDAKQNRVFSWTNTASTGTENERPDVEMPVVNQRTIEYRFGFCEVKVSEGDGSSVDVHNDMLRLARFGKTVCHNEDPYGSMLMMAAASIELPKPLSTLVSFASNVHKIKQIVQAYYIHCTKELDDSRKRRRASSTTKHDIQQVINTSKPKKMKPSLSFK